ncbi:MAG: hypothetical protein HY561_09550, partial [Gemmatimonadetes bacterium]|nr:hypothetical protein [Gemmatimonadota bacterium]
MHRSHAVPSCLAAAALVLAACARPVAVESEPGPAYALMVHNPMPHSMVVSYDDGTGARALGTVEANGHRQFLITSPARQTVTITARDERQTHTTTPQQVTLRTGTTAEVTLG